MSNEQKIEAGQIWRRNAGGKHIRITGERRGWNGASFDDWRWEGADYKGSGVLYGHSLRQRYTLVEALPEPVSIEPIEMVGLADGREVPKACVDALDAYEGIWPGATFPTARASIVAAVLKAYEEVYGG